jgi:PAS domain S-box-containing protein
MKRARPVRNTDAPKAELVEEMHDLRTRLEEAEATLEAIRNGEVDALVAHDERGEHVYALSGSDRFYRQHIEIMSEAAVTLSEEGIVLYCNKRMADLLARPLADVLGSVLRESLPPADRKPFDAVLLEARRAPARAEIRVQTNAGSVVPVQLSATHMCNEGTEIVFCLVLTDLSEQKRQQQELVAAELLARSILEQAAEAIVVCNAEGQVLRASLAAQKYCDAVHVGQPFEQTFLLRTGTADGFCLAPVLQGETLHDVDVAIDRSGQTFALILNAGPLLCDERVAGCVITLTDITERGRAAQDRGRESAQGEG